MKNTSTPGLKSLEYRIICERPMRVNDTDPAVETRYRQMLMALTAQQRVAMGTRMFSSARQIVKASIKLQNPTCSDIDLKIELLKRFYGKDFSPEELAVIIKHLTLHSQPS